MAFQSASGPGWARRDRAFRAWQRRRFRPTPAAIPHRRRQFGHRAGQPSTVQSAGFPASNSTGFRALPGRPGRANSGRRRAGSRARARARAFARAAPARARASGFRHRARAPAGPTVRPGRAAAGPPPRHSFGPLSAPGLLRVSPVSLPFRLCSRQRSQALPLRAPPGRVSGFGPAACTQAISRLLHYSSGRRSHHNTPAIQAVYRFSQSAFIAPRSLRPRRQHQALQARHSQSGALQSLARHSGAARAQAANTAGPGIQRRFTDSQAAPGRRARLLHCAATRDNRHFRIRLAAPAGSY